MLKIGHDHIMGWQVDSFKEETRFMVMELTEGLQIEICLLLSYLHQHLKKVIVYFAENRAGPYHGVAGGQLQGGDQDHGHGVA